MGSRSGASLAPKLRALAPKLRALALVLVAGVIGLERGADYARLDGQDWSGLPPTLGPAVAAIVFIGGGLLLGGIFSALESTREGGKAVLRFTLAMIVGSFVGMAVWPWFQA